MTMGIRAKIRPALDNYWSVSMMKTGLAGMVVVASLATLTSCCGITSPLKSSTPDVDIEALLLDVSEFPSGWYVDVPPHPSDEAIGQIDDRWTQFRCEASLRPAHYEIYLFADVRNAAAQYRLQLGSQFYSAEMLAPWEMPPELPYQSLVADQFQFACAEFEDFPSGRFTRCTAMGQYGRFLVIFSTRVSVDCMTFEELDGILTTIDTQMSPHTTTK
jgi:hypothetical protein